ncbi:hypothetical protein TeGR_g3779 [Tetraparma gracilis]|uniref:HIRAN domain-containing protein n=1 Tax=Tetraparma gracilis TaxID=2962635 RepID=A0ABQ6MWH9_9STRA|nr:hypothetical protein TeGR_g3779 [Tetraparma gracilis]
MVKSRAPQSNGGKRENKVKVEAASARAPAPKTKPKMKTTPPKTKGPAGKVKREVAVKMEQTGDPVPDPAASKAKIKARAKIKAKAKAVVKRKTPPKVIKKVVQKVAPSKKKAVVKKEREDVEDAAPKNTAAPKAAPKAKAKEKVKKEKVKKVKKPSKRELEAAYVDILRDGHRTPTLPCAVMKIVGTSFRRSNCLKAVSKHGDVMLESRFDSRHRVELVPDPNNPYDSNAVKVVLSGEHVGFIPKQNTHLVDVHAAHQIWEFRFNEFVEEFQGKIRVNLGGP